MFQLDLVDLVQQSSNCTSSLMVCTRCCMTLQRFILTSLFTASSLRLESSPRWSSWDLRSWARPLSKPGVRLPAVCLPCLTGDYYKGTDPARVTLDAQASSPAGLESNAKGGADVLSRTHRMTLDEASQILNIKKGALIQESELQTMLKVRDLVRDFFFLLYCRPVVGYPPGRMRGRCSLVDAHRCIVWDMELMRKLCLNCRTLITSLRPTTRSPRRANRIPRTTSSPRLCAPRSVSKQKLRLSVAARERQLPRRIHRRDHEQTLRVVRPDSHARARAFHAVSMVSAVTRYTAGLFFHNSLIQYLHGELCRHSVVIHTSQTPGDA